MPEKISPSCNERYAKSVSWKILIECISWTMSKTCRSKEKKERYLLSYRFCWIVWFLFQAIINEWNYKRLESR